MVKILLDDGSRSMNGNLDFDGNNILNTGQIRGQNKVILRDINAAEIEMRDNANVVRHTFDEGYRRFDTNETDAGSFTNELWSSSDNADELKYNDGAIVQLS